MINLKTKHEIELMASAGRLLNSVITEMKAACAPGVTTGDLDRLADRLIRKGGARPGFLGYQDFPKSTCISVNDEVVHGIPGKRVIKDGDIVSLDLGLVLDGFWADMGCTVAVGRVSPEAERLVDPPANLDPIPGRDLRLSIDVELEQSIWIAAIAHQKRRPGYWSGRVPDPGGAG